jgi:hypothetical protein
MDPYETLKKGRKNQKKGVSSGEEPHMKESQRLRNARDSPIDSQ